MFHRLLTGLLGPAFREARFRRAAEEFTYKLCLLDYAVLQTLSSGELEAIRAQVDLVVDDIDRYVSSGGTRRRAAARQRLAGLTYALRAGVERLETRGHPHAGPPSDPARHVDLLLQFSQALAASRDQRMLRRTLTQYLPLLIHTGEVSVTIHADGEPAIIGDASAAGPDCEVFPLRAGPKVVGSLRVPLGSKPFTESERRLLEAIASLLAHAVTNVRLFRKLRRYVMLDPLTGCATREHAIEQVGAELRRAQRAQKPVSLILFDLDQFKNVNHRYGQSCGDTVLAVVGHCMKKVVRVSDVRCRYGGEEFFVLLPDTPLEGATRVAEALRRRLAETIIKCPTDTLHVTASFGVTTTRPGDVEVHALVARAHAALAHAKAVGGNSVKARLEPPDTTRPTPHVPPTTSPPFPGRREPARSRRDTKPSA